LSLVPARPTLLLGNGFSNTSFMLMAL
jgi:hypothetical protein